MLDLVFGPILGTKPGQDESNSPAVTPIHPMEQLALATLESHPHFRGRSQLIRMRYRNHCLYLSGKLPSYFLKQIAQEALRQLDGVDSIDNQIVVAGHRMEIAPASNAE